ncbi:Tripartite motif containing 37, partial [Cladochytrium tenue]
CWGYNRFHPLATLADNGYIHPDHDRIVLRFYVRATSFEGRCRDLTLYSKHLETQLQRRTSVAEPTGGDRQMIVIENPPSPSNAAKHGNTDLCSVGMSKSNSPPSQPAPLAGPSGSELSTQPRPVPQRTAADHAVDLLPLPLACPPAGRTPSTASDSVPRRPLVDYDPGAYQAAATAAATSAAVATTAASSSLASLYESADAFLSAAETSPSSLSSSGEESAGQHGSTDDDGAGTDDNSEVGEDSESGSAGDAHPGAAITSPVISGSGCSAGLGSVIAGADGLEDQNTAVELFLLSLRNVFGNTFGGSLWNDANARPAPSDNASRHAAAAASDSSPILLTPSTLAVLPGIQAVGAHGNAVSLPATDVAGLRVGRADLLNVLRARVGALLAAVSEQLSDADADTVARLVATPRNPDEGSVGGGDGGGARLQLQGASADEEEALRHRVVAALSGDLDDSSVHSDALSGDSLSSDSNADHSTAMRLDLRNRVTHRPPNDGSGGRRLLRGGVDGALRSRVAALLGAGEFADDENDLDDDDDYEDGESGESVDRDNF